MATFALVHGAWHGAWCWKRLAPLLHAAGHEVYAPTLTGRGDRRHLAHRGVDLELHAADVRGTIETEELNGVTLVAHSYAGMVATIVAAAIPERIATLVYLDAFVPENDQGIFDLIAPEERDGLRALAAQTPPGWRVPPFPPQGYGVSDAADAAWLARRLDPMPVACFESRARFDSQRLAGVRRAYVRASRPDRDRFERFACLFRGRAADYREVPSGHDMMITHPRETAAALVDLLPNE